MLEFSVNLTCINRAHVYYEHNSWPPNRFDLGRFHCILHYSILSYINFANYEKNIYLIIDCYLFKGSSWSWSYSSWIYYYLSNQFLSHITLSDRILLIDTALCDKVCRWVAAGLWFSPCSPLSSTNKTDRDEILLKVVLITTTHCDIFLHCHRQRLYLNWGNIFKNQYPTLFLFYSI